MRLVVIGTGLIGGSFALAARQHGLFGEVLGVDPDPQRREQARELGIVDAVVESVPADADAVLLAGPSHTIAPWVNQLSDHGGVLFDTGSVKGGMLSEIRARSGRLPARFVPCHPMAGSERSGPEAAHADLFDGQEVIVTPAPETDPAAVAQVSGWWHAMGARVTSMPAERHDRILALTSHLPHLVAFAYLQQVGDEHLDHAAGGFRDFTRIGAADADMWAPIFALNRREVLAALGSLEADLARLRGLIEGHDDAAIKAYIEVAARRRRKFDGG